MHVECWNCGELVEPDEEGSCPICEVQFPRFILGIRILDDTPPETAHPSHPDPIKGKEAELAEFYYGWIQKEFFIDKTILPSDYTLPENQQLPTPTLPPTPIRQHTPISAPGQSIPEEEKRFDAVYKIVTLGEESSGKTETLNRYSTGKFDRDYRRTLGIDISTYDAQINDRLFKLLIWDLAGQNIFRDLRTRYCQGASGGLLFFDCTQPQTLQTVPRWIEAFRTAVGPEPPIYLIGAKADMTKERKVPPENARKIVKKLDLSGYYEIPNTHQEFITSIMNDLASQIYKRHTTRRGTTTA